MSGYRSYSQGSSGQGSDGGRSLSGSGGAGGGGGGGAGEVGENGSSGSAGDGGDGLSSSISGSAVSRGGGGGAGYYANGTFSAGGRVALAVAPLLITDKEMEMRQPQIQVVVEAVELPFRLLELVVMVVLVLSFFA